MKARNAYTIRVVLSCFCAKTIATLSLTLATVVLTGNVAGQTNVFPADDSIYFAPQAHFEAGNFPFTLHSGSVAPSFAQVNDPAIPFSRVAVSNSLTEFSSDFIPVQTGDVLYGEIWSKRESGAAGSPGSLYYGIARYDKDKKPIAGNNGLVYFAASAVTVPINGSWSKHSGVTSLPLSHTPFEGSDGGPVRYVRAYIIVNYQTGTIPTYWGGVLLRRVAPFRDAGPVVFNSNVGIGAQSPAAAKLDLFESGQRLTFLTNKRLTGAWPPVPEATTMTLQSSGNSVGNLAFATGNSEAMRITASGSVGIGTTTPATGARLDVNGNARVAGNVEVTGNISVAGNLLAPNYVASSGSVTGSDATGLTLTAGGTNKNVTITPSGTGSTVFNGKVDIAGVTLKHNGLRTHVVNNIAGPSNATDTRRYEIARMGVNQGHWGFFGVIAIELFQTYYSSGTYQKWYVKAGHGDFSGSASLVEKFGTEHYARVVLGAPVLTGNSYGGHPNQYIPVYLEVSHYTTWRIRATHNWPLIENAVPEYSQLKFFDAPSSSTIAGQVTNTGGLPAVVSSALSVNGNVGIGKAPTSAKLDVGGDTNITGNLTVSGAFTAPNYVASNGAIVGSSTSGLTLAAGGTDKNVTVSPTGTGSTVLNGKVGVGTSSPMGAFDVTTGNIKQLVKTVQTTQPDYSYYYLKLFEVPPSNSSDTIAIDGKISAYRTNDLTISVSSQVFASRGYQGQIHFSQITQGGARAFSLVKILHEGREWAALLYDTSFGPGIKDWHLDVTVFNSGVPEAAISLLGVESTTPLHTALSNVHYRGTMIPTGSVAIGSSGQPTDGRLVVDSNVAGATAAIRVTNSAGGEGNRTGIAFGGTGNYGFLDYDPNSANPLRLSSVGSLAFGRNSNAAYGTSTFTESLRLTADGRVGIGTSHPGAKLEIKAGSALQTAPIEAVRIWGPNAPYGLPSAQDLRWAFAGAGSGTIRTYRGLSWDTHMQFLTNPASANGDAPEVRMHIAGDGNVGIGAGNPVAKLDINEGAQRLSFHANKRLSGTWPPIPEATTMTIQSSGVDAGNLAFATGNSERMRITSNGDIGIGTIPNGVKLDVAGNTRVTGSLAVAEGSATISDSSSKLWVGPSGGRNYIESGNAGWTAGAPLLITGYNTAPAPLVQLISEKTVFTGGRVGIGTDSPDVNTVLDVNGNTRMSGSLVVGGATTLNGPLNAPQGATLGQAAVIGASSFGGAMTFGPGTGAGTPPAEVGVINWAGGQAGALQLAAGKGRSLALGADGNISNGLVVATTGNVGIGTAAPAARLSILGPYIDLNTPQLIVDGGSVGAVIGLRTAGTQRGKLRVDASGSVALESTGTGGLDFNWSGGAGDTTFWNGSGVALATIKQSGNVGIGTGAMAPSAKLEVAGDGKYNGSLAVNSTGASGEGLTIGSATSPGGGNLRLLSSSNRWGLENDNGTLRFFRENAGGGSKQVSGSMTADAAVRFEGRVTAQDGLTVATGGINVSSGNVTMSSGSIKGLAIPTEGTDAANVSFVHSQVPFYWNQSTQLVTFKNDSSKLGLGTTIPEYKLDISDTGGARLDNLGMGNGLVLRRNILGNKQSWKVGIGSGSDPRTFKVMDITGEEDRLVITTAGRVGVGTTSPQAMLHIAAPAPGGTDTVSGAQAIIQAPQNSNDHYILFRNGWSAGDRSAGFASVGFSANGSNGGNLWFATKQSGADNAGTPTKRMIIDQAGHVGIGVNEDYFTNSINSDYKLSVAGKVHAQEVVVDMQNWADYVFAENYRNAPLSEVEQHIKQHKHLPGVPSAKEVAEKGVSLGQMQAVLLAKVEELTLHMIELKKENVELRREMENLKNAAAAGRTPL